VTLAEKIALVSCAGVMHQNFRPVTLVGMEQLAELTFNLIRSKTPDIRFAVEKVRANVALIVRMFLNVPNTPLASMHSAYLAPYYSLTTTQSLGAWLADLANALTKAEANNQDASTVIRNIEQWAENLYRTEKEALLIAIEKRSHFTFDVIHWIAHVTKLLVFLSRAPAANDRVKQELPRHALWLIGVLSWIPNDKDTTAFVETFGVTDSIIWRARCGTVLCCSPNRRLTSGVGAGTLNTGNAHGRCVQGGMMTKVKTIHRNQLVATERCLLESSGSR
jgi:hypothetical protein